MSSDRIDTRSRVWLCRFAWFTCVSTLFLISIGGLVTSKGAGMAVPDWPTTYGYNMFLFPFSQWIGGAFYEHSHRLVASGVGLLTTILAIWLWISDPRRWVKALGALAFVLVVLQGVLGGLRVTLLWDDLGIFHAVLAQLFLLLVLTLCVVTGRTWLQSSQWAAHQAPSHATRRFFVSLTVLMLLQLTLGATMRHQHAGLAVPDFPLAYGRIYPKTDEATLVHVNQARRDTREFHDITAGQIHLHMAHRGLACVLVVMIFAAWHRVRKQSLAPAIKKLATALVVLVSVQFALGAFTVWSNKAADVATAHVVVGALSLASSFTLVLLSGRVMWETSRPISAATAPTRSMTPAAAV